QGLAGFGGLLLIIVGSFWVAMTQVDWLYDQAAARGFDTQAVRSLRQKGDMSGLLAEYARQGKVKPGRLAARVANWRVRGGLALLWKDLILQARSSMWSYAVFLPISIFMVAMPVWAVGKLDRASTAMYFLMQGFTVFMIAMQANSGVIEMLRRVDVQKPLPFTPAATVFWEIAAKALPPALISWIAGLCALAINPGLADAFLAAAVMAPSMSFLLVAVVYLMTVLFPDVDDPTQRGFRSLMLLLGIFLLSVPSVAMFLGLTVVGIPLVTGPVAPIAAALPFVLLNALLTFAVAAVTGLLYANFNPSE
ncbi:MAG TPA: putative ABC exporter domain-containing protein, partial [Fimbriimonas sp.]